MDPTECLSWDTTLLVNQPFEHMPNGSSPVVLRVPIGVLGGEFLGGLVPCYSILPLSPKLPKIFEIPLKLRRALVSGSSKPKDFSATATISSFRQPKAGLFRPSLRDRGTVGWLFVHSKINETIKGSGLEATRDKTSWLTETKYSLCQIHTDGVQLGQQLGLQVAHHSSDRSLVGTHHVLGLLLIGNNAVHQGLVKLTTRATAKTGDSGAISGSGSGSRGIGSGGSTWIIASLGLQLINQQLVLAAMNPEMDSQHGIGARGEVANILQSPTAFSVVHKPSNIATQPILLMSRKSAQQVPVPV